jgi:hypothetical protein
MNVGGPMVDFVTAVLAAYGVEGSDPRTQSRAMFNGCGGLVGERKSTSFHPLAPYMGVGYF